MPLSSRSSSPTLSGLLIPEFSHVAQAGRTLSMLAQAGACLLVLESHGALWAIALGCCCLGLLLWARRESPVVAVAWEQGNWQVCRKSGGWVPVVLLPGSICLPWLVCLCWRGPRGRAVLWLWPDSAGREELRHLRRALCLQR